MKILYAAYARMPTEKAHGIQIASMCVALAALGHEVELVVPQRENPIASDTFSYYGMPQSFTVTYLSVGFPRVGRALQFLLGEISFARKVSSLSSLRGVDAVLTRSALCVLFASRKVPTFFEMHDFPLRRLFLRRFFLSRAAGFISTNRWKAERLVALMKGKEDGALIAPNGFDEALFENLPTRETARVSLGLPRDTQIVAYTGNLLRWKGVETLVSASAFFPDTLFLLVGGSAERAAEVLASVEKKGNVRHVPHLARTTIPLYLRAADLLVLPNSASTEESRLGTSPIKLFEYMASGTPVVVSDLPSIREVVDESVARFFAPDDPESLSRAIRAAFADPEGTAARGRLAKEKSKSLSWRSRAARIAAFIAGRISSKTV